MNAINYIQILFSMMISFIIIMGSLINSFEKYLPVFLRQTFRYGKFAYQGNKSPFKAVEVPKSWFKHFYIFSSCLMTFTITIVIKVYLFDDLPPQILIQILDQTTGYFRTATVTPLSALLAVTLLTIQCYRRLFDTQFVSVFGKKSRMNLSHYVVGYIHYAGSVIAILSEAPVFAHITPGKAVFRWSDLTVVDVLASILFLWACYHQYKVTVILANLRKNEKGEIISQEHKLPNGDWFEYVSSPHSLSEVLMYFSLTLILWGNSTFWFIFIWVLSNQVETSLLSHWWYQATFKNFPKHRKAFIPFVY